MSKSVAGNMIIFLLLLLMQVLICNHIMLFNVATPIIFIYVLMRLPMDMPVKMVMLASFMSGFLVDIFSDTPGVNALSCTIFSVLRKPVYMMYTGKDDNLAGLSPSISTLGAPLYMKYLFSMTLIYCMLSIGIEFFTFTSLSRMLLIIICSSVMSFILMLGVDSLMSHSGRHT